MLWIHSCHRDEQRWCVSDRYSLKNSQLQPTSLYVLFLLFEWKSMPKIHLAWRNIYMTKGRGGIKPVTFWFQDNYIPPRLPQSREKRWRAIRSKRKPFSWRGWTMKQGGASIFNAVIVHMTQSPVNNWDNQGTNDVVRVIVLFCI